MKGFRIPIKTESSDFKKMKLLRGYFDNKKLLEDLQRCGLGNILN